jgi:hypothetical protein
VRFHGRRHDTWFSDGPKLPAHERYNYLYSPDELNPWVTRIQEVQKHTRGAFVVTNNHYQGKAVVNALQLLSILKGTKLKVPDDLRTTRSLKKSPAECRQLRHFSRSAHQLGKNRRELFLEEIFKRLPGIQRPPS